MKNKICFFGLLHFKNNENKNLNFFSKNDNQKILVYLKNAILLDKQLKFYGYKLTLITNDKLHLNKLLKNLNYEIDLKSIKFKTYVPKNTHFYACHFRVDVFKFFSKLNDTYSVLLDLDVLILNNPIKLLKYQKKKISLVNNISQNVIPAYGSTEILRKLKILNSKITKVIWYGGDFFAGNGHFYKLLHQKSNFYQKKFIKNIKNLSDQTDELFISAAMHDINKDKKKKIKFGNSLGIFNRYWNTNILHPQKKIDHFKKFIFLHIPADKIFLSNCYENLIHKKNFKDNYFAYVSNFRNSLYLKISNYLPFKIKQKIKNILYS